MNTRSKILGIPTHRLTQHGRSIARQVLQQIKSRCPSDFARLSEKVMYIQTLPIRERLKGIDGLWRRRGPDSGLVTEIPGIVLFHQGSDHAAAILAHELGHACHRFGDDQRRGDTQTDEWANELVADWYAYKWGFGRAIAKCRKDRCTEHHLVTPGQVFEIQGLGRFRLSRRFVVRKLRQRHTNAHRKPPS